MRESGCDPSEMERRARCFVAEAGDADGSPCWGELTVVPNVLLPDEGGGEPGDVLLCEGHLPIARGERYRPRPNTS